MCSSSSREESPVGSIQQAQGQYRAFYLLGGQWPGENKGERAGHLTTGAVGDWMRNIHLPLSLCAIDIDWGKEVHDFSLTLEGHCTALMVR